MPMFPDDCQFIDQETTYPEPSISITNLQLIAGVSQCQYGDMSEMCVETYQYRDASSSYPASNRNMV